MGLIGKRGAFLARGSQDSWLIIAPDVAEALAAGAPVVALESTIISHGMPYPQNVETARAVEAEVLQAGAVPATIAVIDGKARVGLGEGELEKLGRANTHDGVQGYGAQGDRAQGDGDRAARVAKAGRRDLAVLLAKGLSGATTVSGTMAIAARAGIRVFATGGIGGVHRGAAETFDISSDLTELARTPVAVVCAGAKAILDLPLTLEYLETLGVPVVGVGTDEFPAFYTPKSGLFLEHRVDSPAEAARLLWYKWNALGDGGGVVFANPVPAGDALDARAVTAAVEEALAQARREGVAGKAVTPFLLKRVVELTGGASLAANISLVKNNARFAARLAKEYARLARQAGGR